jgi:hypothetical protein
VKRSKIVTLLLLSAAATFAQKTIVVKKYSKVSEVRLDSSFTRLLVYDQLHKQLDSSIVSFEMMVEVPVDDIYYGAPGGPIYKVKTPVTYKSTSDRLTDEMKKAWSIHPKGQPVKFQNIYVKVGAQKQAKWRDFTVKKP